MPGVSRRVAISALVLAVLVGSSMMGFHAPEEAARILGQATNILRQAQVLVRDSTFKPEIPDMLPAAEGCAPGGGAGAYLSGHPLATRRSECLMDAVRWTSMGAVTRMKRFWSSGALAAVLVLSAGTLHAEESWKTLSEKPYLVKVRPRPGTQAKDVWAEGELDASAADVQAVLSAPDSYKDWMPYVKESRTLEQLPDGAKLTYTRLDLPMVSDRDYVSRVVPESTLAGDGSGVFAQSWSAQPDAIPQRHGTVRLRLNEGSWRVEPRGEGKSYAVYRFTVDPAGSIPGFLANMGQKDGVVDTFRAVEKRARQHAEERKKSR